MKHLVLFFLLLFSLHSYSQDTTMYTHEDGSIEISYLDSNNILETSILVRENFQRWVTYYPNGQEREVAFYLSGHKEGRWLKYDEDGNIIHIAYYQLGHLIKVEKFFHKIALR